MDRISKEKRSDNMSRIRGKDTSIEIKVRKYLFSKGFRYRKNVKTLPGTPDIVLRKYNTVIFVNGCYWHRHPYCKLTTTPKTNTDFWRTKFDRNVQNDRENYTELEKAGWNVIVLWQCELKADFETLMIRTTHELENSYYIGKADEQITP